MVVYNISSRRLILDNLGKKLLADHYIDHIVRTGRKKHIFSFGKFELTFEQLAKNYRRNFEICAFDDDICARRRTTGPSAIRSRWILLRIVW